MGRPVPDIEAYRRLVRILSKKRRWVMSDVCPKCHHVHLSYKDEPCVSCGCDYTYCKHLEERHAKLVEAAQRVVDQYCYPLTTEGLPATTIGQLREALEAEVGDE